MNNLFDYTYYRTAKRHFKRDGADAFTAILTISFVIFLYILPVYYSLINIFNFKLSQFNDKIILSVIGILIFLIIKKKYKDKYFTFRDKWINETKKEKLFGEVLIVIFFFSPFLLMLLMNNIF